MPSDPIDECWDDLHPPRPDSWDHLPFPEDHVVDPIKEIDELLLLPAAHLVLAWSWNILGRGMDRLRGLVHPRATIDTPTSHLPCFIYGNTHWSIIQIALEGLLESGRQAFIGTMNTYVIDCFYFYSSEDVRSRILFVSDSYRFFRMDPDTADNFYRAYDTKVQTVSEILITEGIW